MQNKLILLKENNPVLAFYLQIELEDIGYTVMHVQDKEDLDLLFELNSPNYLIWGTDELSPTPPVFLAEYILNIFTYPANNIQTAQETSPLIQIRFNKPFCHYQLKSSLQILKNNR